MMRRALIVAAGACCLGGWCFGQLPGALTNGGFELDWQNLGHPAGIRPGHVFGFSNNNDHLGAYVRSLTDGLSPAPLVRSGNRSIALGPITYAHFYGFTTDTVDSFGPNYTFLYYDVPIDWWAGDIEATIWYAIRPEEALAELPPAPWPTNAPAGPFPWPVSVGPAAMKLDIKGSGNGFEGNATWAGWEMAAVDRDIRARDNLISGHTNGQWRQFRIYWPASTPDRKGWKDIVIDQSALGRWSLPPLNTQPPNPSFPSPRFPDRCKITIGRWLPEIYGPSGGADGGIVYLDDLVFTQHPAGPAPCGPADIGKTGGIAGPDGALDNNDFIVFIDYFFAQDARADRGTTGGVPGQDGAWDNNDFIVFIDQFFGGCGV